MKNILNVKKHNSKFDKYFMYGILFFCICLVIFMIIKMNAPFDEIIGKIESMKEEKRVAYEIAKKSYFEAEIDIRERKLDHYSKNDINKYIEIYDRVKEELKSLNNEIGKEFIDKYRIPQDLFYTFLKTDNAYVSQSPRQHYVNNGFLATDVATNGRNLDVYAPDYLNNEYEYRVDKKEYKDTTGNTIILIEKNEKFKWLIGHVESNLNEGDIISTGQIIGKVMSEDEDGVGVSSGEHVHIEFYPKVDGKWQVAEYRISESNKHEIINNNISNSNRIYITSYNPVPAQTDSTPCIGAAGVDLCQKANEGVRVIALSQDLVGRTGSKRFKYGDTITIKGDIPDSRCNGTFIVLDTMNARWSNRGDLFFMNRKDNISCNATII